MNTIFVSYAAHETNCTGCADHQLCQYAGDRGRAPPSSRNGFYKNREKTERHNCHNLMTMPAHSMGMISYGSPNVLSHFW